MYKSRNFGIRKSKSKFFNLLLILIDFKEEQVYSKKNKWNFEEFSVKIIFIKFYLYFSLKVPYQCIANELKVGSYYINNLLKNLDTFMVYINFMFFFS